MLDLAKMGAMFTKKRSGDLHLTQEGGHSARRVVHAEDATGISLLSVSQFKKPNSLNFLAQVVSC